MGSRSPMLTAMAAATVQERTGGRAVLGLGTGRRCQAPRPPARARSARSAAPVEGEVSLRRAGARADLAVGARTARVRLAGEIADGVLLNWCPPERVAQARAAVSEAAPPPGRDPAERARRRVRAREPRRGPRAADLALREAAAQYASYPAYARQFDAVGLGDEAARCRAGASGSRPGRARGPPAGRHAPGDPAAAAGRLEEYRDAGADLPVVYPVAAGDGPRASLTATIRALAPA